MYQAAIATIRRNYRNISSKDDQHIQEAVSLLLKGIDQEGGKKYPLPVVQLLKGLGFELYRARFKNPEQSGVIAVDSTLPEQAGGFQSDRVILVNELDTTAHQRFTIAHELAHYIFDYDEATQPRYYKPYLTSEKRDETELRANRFAAELLMPTDDFRAKFEALKSAQGDAFSLPGTITQLSKFFDAPPTSVELRLRETRILS